MLLQIDAGITSLNSFVQFCLFSQNKSLVLELSVTNTICLKLRARAPGFVSVQKDDSTVHLDPTADKSRVVVPILTPLVTCDHLSLSVFYWTTGHRSSALPTPANRVMILQHWTFPGLLNVSEYFTARLRWTRRLPESQLVPTPRRREQRRESHGSHGDALGSLRTVLSKKNMTVPNHRGN